MLKLIMTKGLPGSGKTTWSKELIKSEPGKWKRVNKDDLRGMLDAGVWSNENEKFIVETRDRFVWEALKSKYNVIVDDTNFSPKHEKTLISIAQEHNAEFEVKDFTDVSVYECIRRDKLRPNPVGRKVIVGMYEKYLRPLEPKIQEKEHLPGLPNVCLVDIDGTLAHMKDRSPFDWHRVGEDSVDTTIKNLLSSVLRDGNSVILVSGRDSVCRPETEEWLEKNNITYDHLFMRPESNNEKDTVVKERIYRENIEGKYNVLFVLDDRTQVVNTWRSLGLKCFQVAPGDF